MNIVFFGNPLHGDDAVGYHIYNELIQLCQDQQICDKNSAVKLHFAGSSALDAVKYFTDTDSVIVVDAHLPAGKPGKIEILMPDELYSEGDYLSIHRFSVYETIKAMQAEGLDLPEIRLLTVEAKLVNTFSLDMSDEVTAVVKPVSELLLKLIKQNQSQLKFFNQVYAN